MTFSRVATRRAHGFTATQMNSGISGVVLLLVWLNTPLAAGAQEAIEPDRPDVTNGTHIVDIGLLQIELGGLFTRAAPGDRQLGTPFTARVGVFEWLEARFGTDGLLTQTDGFTSVTGIGNMQVGAKLRLWADPGGIPVLSILPTVNVPTASTQKGLGSGVADYTLAVLTGAARLRCGWRAKRAARWRRRSRRSTTTSIISARSLR